MSTSDGVPPRHNDFRGARYGFDMRVDRATAARIISALIAKGFLRRAVDQSSQTEKVFEPVR